MKYTFTLKYHLPDCDDSVDDVVEQLGAALVSALLDVKRAVPSGKLIETTLAAHS